jgi:ATP-dependent Clp protease ATP-binding subunit ClpA
VFCQQYLENPLAQAILKGQFDGGKNIRVTLDDEKVFIQ